jgi:hypothetical protein
MIDSFYIGLYWGSKAETLTQVANKVLQTLQRLAKIDEQFLNWYERGMSRKQALEKKVSLDADTIEAICRKAVQKGELDERGYAKNGVVFGLWTGHRNDAESSISFIAGDVFVIPNLCNNCVISIPFEGAARVRLLQAEKAKEIITSLAEIWEPDYAVLSSHSLRDKLNAANKVGWVTYHKSIKKFPSISNKVVYEKANNGHWFYIKDSDYNETLINELLPVKAIF